MVKERLLTLVQNKGPHVVHVTLTECDAVNVWFSRSFE
jgi:hypothetical protein